MRTVATKYSDTVLMSFRGENRFVSGRNQTYPGALLDLITLRPYWLPYAKKCILFFKVINKSRMTPFMKLTFCNLDHTS